MHIQSGHYCVLVDQPSPKFMLHSLLLSTWDTLLIRTLLTNPPLTLCLCQLLTCTWQHITNQDTTDFVDQPSPKFMFTSITYLYLTAIRTHYQSGHYMTCWPKSLQPSRLRQVPIGGRRQDKFTVGGRFLVASVNCVYVNHLPVLDSN